MVELRLGEGKLVMETWHTELARHACADCGRPFLTEKQLEFLKERAEKELGQQMELCPACRRRLTGKNLKSLAGAADRMLHLDTKNARDWMRQGKEVSIDTDPDQPVWTDGEYTGRTPISMKVIPGALPVVVT